MSAAAPPPRPASTELEHMLEAPLGLRERKKLKTRRAIRSAAFSLFADQGYEATTVDQIAAVAEVSPSTFFRYFPTKEDLVISDDYDPLLEAAFRARPKDEPLRQALRTAMVGPLRQVLAAERDEMLLRMELYRQVPAIRARAMTEQQQTSARLCRLIAERTGEDPAGLHLRVLVTTIVAAAGEAVLYWSERGGVDDMTELLDQALDVVIGP
ncbi:TetR family transcriptional regulator [Streptacidiphilus sp. MAP5-3]|uniref:acyl-CoA-like ligand-binding transcription factor n=1 Tax=unclassified Streptacidiphilus TaxID=2643834 RepID=UPI003516C15A